MMRTRLENSSRTLLAAAAALLASALFAGAPSAALAQTEIKLATLAPPGSSWMKIFNRARKEIAKKTGGQVKLKIYGGGSQGDEKVVVEKIRAGQVHAAAITAVGLAEIAPDVLILQAPGLVTDHKVLDKLRAKMKTRFEEAFRQSGFELLGWGDVGVYFFYSAHSISRPKDLKKTRFWVWNADPAAREVAKVAGVSSVPLGVPDVLPSLNTGHIDTFYTSALATLSLQWFTKVKHRIAMPFAMGIGAIVIDKGTLDALPPEHRKVVVDTVGKWARALVKKVRADNKRAITILRQRGITDVDPDPTARAEWNALTRKVQDALAGRVYSMALLDEARRLAGVK